MSEYSVSDYGIFKDAVSSVKRISDLLENNKSDLEKNKSDLNSESVFMGPICDSCVDGFGKIDTRLDATYNNYTKISNYIVDTAKEYKDGDTSAVDKVLSIDDTGKIQVTKVELVTAYANPANLSEDGYQYKFIQEILEGALKSYKEDGVLPSLTLAQAILETGWGKHRIGNNIFGIKAGSSWTGKTQNVATSEQNSNGSYSHIRANFRDYDSVSDSIVDHGKLLTKDMYKPVIAAKNYREACQAVKNCGYATSHSYAQNLINLVEQYGLNQWDPK